MLWHPRLAAAHSDARQLTPSLARNQRFARFSGESGNITLLGRLSLDVVMTLPNVRCQPASHHPKRRPKPNDAPKRRIIWLALVHSGPTRPAAPVRGAGWLGLGFPFKAPQSTAVNRSKPSIFLTCEDSDSKGVGGRDGDGGELSIAVPAERKSVPFLPVPFLLAFCQPLRCPKAIRLALRDLPVSSPPDFVRLTAD